MPKRPHIGSDYLTAFAYLHRMNGDQARTNVLLLSCVPYALANLAVICSEYEVEPTSENIAELWAERLMEHPMLERLERFNQDGARLLTEEIKFWNPEPD